MWHLNIIINTIQQRRNSDLGTFIVNRSLKSFVFPETVTFFPYFPVSMDGNESEEKSSFKDRHDIVTKNYVKPVMSGFLFVSSLKDREAEQRHEQQCKDQAEEPEWFSCGPTSCLDTIELM
uniref:Uncharacterized protein n=1 Tax=Glossina palpalis gambiensis TaxID=67801 RepID=A0A1B0BXG6_9MUSC